MSLQTTVNTKQAYGLVGTFYDDSPRRVAPYSVQGNPSSAVAAEGVITIGAQVTANDTVTVANITYKFVASPSAAYDVDIGADAEGTIANLVAAINGTGTAGTTYGTGTVANAYVSAVAGTGEIELTAKTAGSLGNVIILSETFTSASNTVTAFADGADAGAPATIGCAFTLNASDNSQAFIGGSGGFAGILVGPHEYVIQGLGASLVVDNGTAGELCTFGHIIVQPANTVSVGDVAAFDTTTGQIYGYSSSASIPAGQTQIANSKFIFVDGTSTQVACLELGN